MKNNYTIMKNKYTPSREQNEEVRGCLQNLYQSVAIHLKYVLLVLL